jgi:hypothetical protein
MDAMKKKCSIVGRANVVVILAVVILTLASSSRSWAQDDDGPMSDLKFVVVRDYNGKPVRNAAVVLHPVSKKGKQARGGLELKTDNEGRTNIDGIPYGLLRIQVLVPGFQTFGEDYVIDKPQLEITVKLKRPGGQYSVYEDHGEKKKADDKKAVEQKADQQKPADPKPQP